MASAAVSPEAPDGYIVYWKKNGEASFYKRAPSVRSRTIWKQKRKLGLNDVVNFLERCGEGVGPEDAAKELGLALTAVYRYLVPYAVELHSQRKKRSA